MTEPALPGTCVSDDLAGISPKAMPATEEAPQNVRAAIYMLVAVGSFSVMDACIKAISNHYAPVQIASIRGLSSLPIVLFWVAFSGGFAQLLRVRFSLHLLRGALGIMMLAAFAFSLRTLPLSAAYSIFFVAPLLITAFAVPILGEKVGWRRWTAIVVGLCGVLIVLRPGATSVNIVAGLAVLASATGYAISAITVRVLGRTDSTVSMVFWLMLLMGTGAAVIAAPAWTPIRATDLAAIGGIAVSGSLGQWAITEAFSRGESSFVAPFEYTAIAWGVGIDLMIWGRIPTAITFVGSAVIIASGLYLIRREKIVAQSDATGASPDASSEDRGEKLASADGSRSNPGGH